MGAVLLFSYYGSANVSEAVIVFMRLSSGLGTHFLKKNKKTIPKNP